MRRWGPRSQYAWPLLARETGAEVWVKHENHTPTGAFKVRGGLVHMARRKERGLTKGVITATRGNHGQSIPFAAKRAGVAATIVVPFGNSPEKNACMRALGADLIEAGSDFDAARETALKMAGERDLDFVPSFHPDLVTGVATYAMELFQAAGALDAVYVPIGLGSGICGVIGMRDLLGLKTRVIGVVAERAAAYQLSLEQGASGFDQFRGVLRRRHGGAHSQCRRLPHDQARRRAHRRRQRGRDRRGDAPSLPRHPQSGRGGRGRGSGGAGEGEGADEGQARGRHPVGRQYRHGQVCSRC